MTNGDDVPDPRGGPRAALVWVLRTDHGAVMFVREAASSALTVAMVGLLLFAVSGVWPPLVAVESGSMQPNMEKGDLVFVMEEQRFAPEYDAADTTTGSSAGSATSSSTSRTGTRGKCR
jgi:signal peptidase